jgi:hypothetical protein
METRLPGLALDNLLKNLIGRWSLTGKMGDTTLCQEVNARWVLRELFVEMRCSPIRVGDGGNPDYEALYLIGYDKKTSEYILHLFDTFGVTSKPVPGIGTRKDNTVRFKFDYTVGPWFNMFTWNPAPRSWKNMVTYERKDGSEGTFAEKELIPLL